jgi:hypothetical protein
LIKLLPLLKATTKASTTTKNPSDEFSNKSQTNYQKFFSLALLNLDTRNVSEAQIELVGSRGGNSTLARKYFVSLRSLLTNLTSTPNEAQKALMRQSLSEVLDLEKAFIAALPGLTNFETDEDMIFSPNNSDFYRSFNKLQSEGKYFIQYPEYNRAYFTNISVPDALAQLVDLAFKVSEQPQACELLNHVFFSEI